MSTSSRWNVAISGRINRCLSSPIVFPLLTPFQHPGLLFRNISNALWLLGGKENTAQPLIEISWFVFFIIIIIYFSVHFAFCFFPVCPASHFYFCQLLISLSVSIYLRIHLPLLYSDLLFVNHGSIFNLSPEKYTRVPCSRFYMNFCV